ncbi:hypothetical protein PN471_21190 [Aphanizomenon sp. CS-733/32]|nr:hypothetical protein [Aphanizomenon sp. CS-733/32]MDB9311094.1 hypothetical protein [Aphanizomenon sp. CS-733/32]
MKKYNRLNNAGKLTALLDISENCQTLTMNTFWKAIANCKYLHILH